MRTHIRIVRMGYEVRPDGTIVVPDEVSAIRLSRKLREDAARAETAPATATRKAAGRRQRAHRASVGARRTTPLKVKSMLSILARAGQAGVASDDLAKEMGIASAKGLSPYARATQQALALKVPAESLAMAFWNRKVGRDGPRRWYVNAEILRAHGVL